MCTIAGFYNPDKHYLLDKLHKKSILSSMASAQSRREQDHHGVWLSEHCGLAHTEGAGAGPKPHQPISKTEAGLTFAAAFCGTLYNPEELREDLKSFGHTFQTSDHAEIVLAGYMEYGPEFVKRLNGVFAYAVMDPIKNSLFLFRDQVGVKPLFYTVRDGEILFASQLKGIFACPGIRPQLDKRGLNEVFSLGPARTSGCGVFTGMEEVLPGHYLCCSPGGVSRHCYWTLESRPHLDSYQKTVEKTSFLVQDAILRQTVSDAPVCTFLSGGVDSSLVSAVCAASLKKQGRQLNTFSFDFTDNDKYFRPNAFQPSLDRPYVDKMVQYLGSSHHFLECSSLTQADRLYDSVLAHDLPAMGDIDSSMLHFCSLVTETHSRVALTGECADEISGGYPWFHKKECFEARAFPWTMDLEPRKVLLKEDFIQYLGMDSYVREAYERSVAETPALAGEDPVEARRREISYLNLRWFMQTLLGRMDRAGASAGLEARVPFADRRIIEYAWNVPWEMKSRGGVVKSLLRQSASGLLPDEILFRRKSPYPKTYDTGYEALLASRVREMTEDSQAPVLQFLDRKKLEAFLARPSDYGKPWYGQLMAGPQMLAYILQVNFWLKHYEIQLI